MFHEVKDPPFQFPERYNKHSFLRIKTFQERIQYINNNYTIIPISSLHNYVKNNNYAVLTFDDGTLDHYTTVFPYLKSLNIPATFFVPSSCIEQKELNPSHAIQFLIASKKPKHIVEEIKNKIKNNNFDELYNRYSKSLFKNNTWTPDEIFVTRFLRAGLTLEQRTTLIQELFSSSELKEQLYMTIDHVKEISADPLMTIGSHGDLSWNLLDVPRNIKEKEIKCSSDLLDKLGITEKYFSYPNGGYNDEIIEILKKYNYSLAVTTETHSNFNNIMALPRLDGTKESFGQPKIVLCGVQQQGIDIIMFLKKHGIVVTHVVTIDEKEAQRQKASGWVDYTQQLPNDISIYHAQHYGFKTEADFEYFHENRFDILLLGGWQRLIPGKILNIVKYGGIGQHGSSDFLPKYRGRSPINWSIILGKKRIVWHLFRMKAGIDNGDILNYQIFEINEWDDCKTIYYKVAIAVKYMLLETIPKLLNDTVISKKQIGTPTFYGKRTPKDGVINWSNSVYTIYNLIRGVTDPYPGAFTYKNDKQIMIWKAQPFSAYLSYYIDNKAGEIVEVFDSSYVVKAEEGLLLITESSDYNPKVGEIYKNEI